MYDGTYEHEPREPVFDVDVGHAEPLGDGEDERGTTCSCDGAGT